MNKSMGWTALACLVAFGLGNATRADDDDEARLPRAVWKAIEAAFPGTDVDDADEEELELTVFEVTLKQGEDVFEAVITQDGTVMTVETECKQAALPPIAAAELLKLVGDGQLKTLERYERRARLGAIALPRPEVLYEAEYTKDGREYEVLIDGKGQVVEQDDDDGDDDSGDDDGDDDDRDGDDD